MTAEAVFSVAGRVVTKRRASLSAAKISDSIFINFNSRLSRKSEPKLYTTLFQSTREAAKYELETATSMADEQRDADQETDKGASSGTEEVDEPISDDEAAEEEALLSLQDSSVTIAKDFLDIVQPTSEEELEDEVVISDEELVGAFDDGPLDILDEED